MSKNRRLSERRHEDYRLIVLFLACIGVRFGELAALCVGRLDLRRRRAVTAESVTLVGSRQVFGTPKSHEGREVPIPPSYGTPRRPWPSRRAPTSRWCSRCSATPPRP